MAWTQADLDKINSQIVRAAQSVRAGDKAVTFRPLDELMRVKAEIETSLATSSGSRVRAVRLCGEKGL